jgi:hypothetical protein
MSLLLEFFQWMFVGLIAVLLFIPLEYDGYLQVILLVLFIFMIVPAIERNPAIGLPILHSIIVRFTLWLYLVLAAIITFPLIPQEMAQLIIHEINHAQQFNYLGQGKFSVSLEELKISSIDNKYYHFNLVVQNSDPPSVKITAKASSKYPLKSYTGAIFKPKSDTKGTFLQVICETRKPSQAPPDMPTSPNSKSDRVTCPFGSNDVTQEMAKFNKPSPDLSHNGPPLEDPQIAFP